MKLLDHLAPVAHWDFFEFAAWCPVVNNWCLGSVLCLVGLWESSFPPRDTWYVTEFYVWWGTMHVFLGFHLFVGAAYGCGWIVTMTVLGAVGGEAVWRSTRTWERLVQDLDVVMLWVVCGAFIGCAIGFGLDQFLAWSKSWQPRSHSETDTSP